MLALMTCGVLRGRATHALLPATRLDDRLSMAPGPTIGEKRFARNTPSPKHSVSAHDRSGSLTAGHVDPSAWELRARATLRAPRVTELSRLRNCQLYQVLVSLAWEVPRAFQPTTADAAAGRWRHLLGGDCDVRKVFALSFVQPMPMRARQAVYRDAWANDLYFSEKKKMLLRTRARGRGPKPHRGCGWPSRACPHPRHTHICHAHSRVARTALPSPILAAVSAASHALGPIQCSPVS